MRNSRKESAGDTPRRVQRPSRQILADGAYEALKEMVMDHRVDPGERLNIEELARQLGVSPTPVREALARLESDGLATKRALSGYAAAPVLDTAALADLFEIRHLLEPRAASRCAEFATETDIASLRSVAAKMHVDDMGETYEQYRTFATHDAQFHDLIATYSRNPVLARVLSGLRFHWHLYRLRFATEVGVDTIAEHERIVDAIQQHDVAGANRAMEAHLIASQNRLIPAVETAYESKLDSGPRTGPPTGSKKEMFASEFGKSPG